MGSFRVSRLTQGEFAFRMVFTSGGLAIDRDMSINTFYCQQKKKITIYFFIFL